MLLSDRRHMISGRGFIGIAAQSLGTGRPVLPPQLAAMLPCVITKSLCLALKTFNRLWLNKCDLCINAENRLKIVADIFL